MMLVICTSSCSVSEPVAKLLVVPPCVVALPVAMLVTVSACMYSGRAVDTRATRLKKLSQQLAS